MNKKLIKVLEDQGWFISKGCDGWNISQFSPLGEDYEFYVADKNLIHNIVNVIDGFDVDIHAESFIACRGRHGIPESVTALVKDAQDIEAMLQLLKKALEKEFPEEFKKSEADAEGSALEDKSCGCGNEGCRCGNGK